MIIVTASDIVTGSAIIIITAATGSVIVTPISIITMIAGTTAAITIRTDSGFGFRHDRSLGVGDRFFLRATKPGFEACHTCVRGYGSTPIRHLRTSYGITSGRRERARRMPQPRDHIAADWERVYTSKFFVHGKCTRKCALAKAECQRRARFLLALPAT